jgi:hypothetical protein
VGDTVRTKSLSKAEVTFVDGNILRLAEKTAVEIKEYMLSQDRLSATLRLARGKIHNIVKMAGRLFGADKKDRFEVHTPTAVAGVRGTNFFSYYLKSVSGAVFQEGTGYGYNVNKPEDVKTIHAGQAMVVAGPDKVPMIKPATEVEFKQHINDTDPSQKLRKKSEGDAPGPSDVASLAESRIEHAAGNILTSSVSAPGLVVVDIPPPIPGPGSEETEFAASLNLAFLESGTMTGSFSKTTGAGTISVSGVMAEEAFPDISHAGDVSGTMGDGSAFAGFLGGAVGSWSAVFNSLYAREGNIGYFYGDLSGFMDWSARTLSASGNVYRTPGYGSATITPEEGETLKDALLRTMSSELFDPGRLPIISNLDMSTGAVAGTAYSSDTLGIETSTGRVLGIWRGITRYGFFSNPSALTSNTFLYGQYAESDYYMLGQVSASDDLNGHVAMTGSLTYMDTCYMGDLSLWYRGSYDYGYYSSAGVGTFTLDPLAYTGYWNTGGGNGGEACLYSNSAGYFQWVGADYGILGGRTAPWDHDSSPFRAMGNYSGEFPEGHLLWNTRVSGWAPDDLTTGFAGLTGGIWKNETNIYGSQYGNLAAIYMTADGRAGLLTSTDLSGYHYPGLSMWYVDGTLVRDQRSTVSNPGDYEIYEDAISGALDGRFGGTSAIRGLSSWGTTLFFKDYATLNSLPWGIYELRLGYGNSFEGKPAGLASWSAVSGGLGSFGYTGAGGEQIGYWIAPVAGTWSDDGEILGSLAGTYLTLSQRGTLGGPFRGVSTTTGSGTWIGQSVGTFKGEPLTFSSSFGFLMEGQGIPTYRLVPGTTYEGRFAIRTIPEAGGMEDVASYNYEYFVAQSDSRLLYGLKEPRDMVGTESWMDVYLPDARVLYFYERQSPFSPFYRYSEGTWVIGSMAESDFSTPPEGWGSWQRDSYEQFPSNALEQSGTAGGILGGVGNPWTASAERPVQINLMGHYHSAPIGESFAWPSLFGTEVMQSVHTSGGAYSGYVGGVLGEVAVGSLYAVYIAENGGSYPAGILKGSFSGPVYLPINLWEASGSLYAMPMTSGMDLAPADLQANLDRGFMAAWVNGNFGSQGSFLEGDLGWGNTLSIRGHNDWGVFNLFLGYANHFSNPLYSGTWSARAGGWAEFGTLPGVEGNPYDIGMWISAPIAGRAGSGFLASDFSGTFLTYAKYGQLRGDLIGTYDNTAQAWQAYASGYWSNSQKLKFNGILDARTARTAEVQFGYWTDGYGSFYNYSYYPYETTAWSTYYVESTNTKKHVKFDALGKKETWTDTNGNVSYSEETWAGSLLDALKTGGPSGSVEPGSVSRYLEQKGWAEGLMGGLTDLWSATAASPAQLRFMGEFDSWWGASASIPVFSATLRSYNPYESGPTIWNQDDNSQNGAYYAYMGGYGTGDLVFGNILGLYLDRSGNAGFVKGSMSGQLYSNLEMWEGSGSLYPIEVVLNTGYNAADLTPDGVLSLETTNGPMDWHGYFMNSSGAPVSGTDIHWLSYDREKASIYLEGQPWRLGVASTLYGGTFNGATDYWSTTFDHTASSGRMITTYVSDPEIPGTWSAGLISGKAYESWANWNDAVTGVSGAQLKGTFDPNARTWQAVAQWAWMDTATFMALTATVQGREKLTALNIPCFEIGKTSLTQAGGVVNNLQNVYMNDVTFFAYRTGANPRIWATDKVGGDYVGTPSTTGPAVPLSGSHGLSASFEMKRWDGVPGGNWGATVNGGGTYTGAGTMNGMTVDMKGAAAGKIDSPGTGKFSGTGSGQAARVGP